MESTTNDNSSHYRVDDNIDIHQNKENEVHENQGLKQNQIALQGLMSKRNAARTVKPGESENGNYHI